MDFIIEMVQKFNYPNILNRHGEELCIVCLGPLTNMFLVHQLYPEFHQRVGGLVIMGGTYLSVGNTNNACGEFNVLTDVEATSAIFSV